jgi:hypothetical protein
MDFTWIVKMMSESKSAFLTGFIIVIGLFFNMKAFKADYIIELSKFQENIQDKVEKKVREFVDDLKSVINQHDMEFLGNAKAHTELTSSVNNIQKLVNEMNDTLKKHDKDISIYNDYDAFIREVRQTVNHSLDVLDDDDKRIAKEYLYVVSQKVIEMIDYIQSQGLTTLCRLDYDIFVTNSINDCKQKFTQLYGSNLASLYFKTTLPVFSYKDELFKIIEDVPVNNIDRRWKTLTLHWLEVLCSNFIRTMYIKKK